MKILETGRLILREVNEDDAEFILDLVNQPSFIQYIGDRGVRTLDQARDYIESRFSKNYRELGFGMYAVELAEARGPVLGICGFVKRDELSHPDIGFAFLPQYGGRGFALESAQAMMEHGRDKLGFSRVLAITALDNASSARLHGKLGFTLEREIEMGYEVLNLFCAI
jgi:RimJ/RimL family protein N-acetyltransferase